MYDTSGHNVAVFPRWPGDSVPGYLCMLCFCPRLRDGPWDTMGNRPLVGALLAHVGSVVGRLMG